MFGISLSNTSTLVSDRILHPSVPRACKNARRQPRLGRAELEETRFCVKALSASGGHRLSLRSSARPRGTTLAAVLVNPLQAAALPVGEFHFEVGDFAHA